MFHASSAEEVSGTHWGPAPHHLHKFVSDSMHDTAPQGEHPGYRLPPEPIPTILDAPPTPLLTLSPDRSRLAWFGRRGLPPLAELAEPQLGLAGVRLNPRTNMRSRQDHLVSLSIGGLDNATPRPIELPEGARLTYPRWSPDSRHLAFVHTSREAELWIVDVEAKTCRRLALPPLSGAFGIPYRWLPDGSGLLAFTIVPDRGAPPPTPEVASGPLVQESSGVSAPTRTYRDLLDGPHSERLFEFYFTGQLWHVALDGTTTPIGAPGLIASFDPAPRGDVVLLERLRRPFSYLVPYHRFPLEVDVVDLAGKEVRSIARLPLADQVPVVFDAVPAGPRGFHWRADAPAELVWVEALDEGDPRNPAALRDRLVILSDPDGEPRSLLELEHRYAGIQWGDDQLAIVYSRWWATRTERRIAISPSDPEKPPRLLSERSYQDAYNDPGWPATRRNHLGRSVLQTAPRGSAIFLMGEGASPEGSRPFLDRFDLETGETSRLWRSAEGEYEAVAVILDDSGKRILTRRESSNDPPNYRIRDLSRKSILQITGFTDPAPQLAGLGRRLITYRRADGVNLSGTLLTPPGYLPERDGPLPILFWAYPREFRDPGDAGQVLDSPYRFSRPTGASHLFLLTQGYAILDGPAMPIVGEGDAEPNDSYIEQLVANAEAAVEAVVNLGVGDRERIAVGGHSYGAFMTANLLAHTSLFRAGIARSGAYNRTLTPFGFQQEQRSYWEAADTYHRMSPFTHADRLRATILLIHGAEDNNPGTYPLQSERFYHALKGHGATVRYVVLPHESHNYRARESVLHVLAEMVEWLDRWLKPEGRRE